MQVSGVSAILCVARE